MGLLGIDEFRNWKLWNFWKNYKRMKEIRDILDNLALILLGNITSWSEFSKKQHINFSIVWRIEILPTLRFAMLADWRGITEVWYVAKFSDPQLAKCRNI